MNNDNIEVEETMLIFHMKFGEPSINEKLDFLSFITGFYMDVVNNFMLPDNIKCTTLEI